MDEGELEKLVTRQAGVVARFQVISLGGSDADIARLVRRRMWKRVHSGVYVDHTGPLTWEQRAWAAVLAVFPAVLAGGSALHAHRVRGFDHTGQGPIEVAIAEDRRVRPPRGVRVRRVTAFDEMALRHLSPPRVRLEHAALDVAGRANSDDDAVATLADICQRGHSTPQRLCDALDVRPTLRRRQLLREILSDIACGAYSALERRYLVRVERRHGLPTGSRQRRVAVGRQVYYRDVEYVGTDTTVELDGRMGHELARDRWDDLERDLAGALTGHLTLRLGWRQVLEPCRLASLVGRVLVLRGWDGALRPCGPRCPVGSGAFHSPAA